MRKHATKGMMMTMKKSQESNDERVGYHTQRKRLMGKL